MRPDPFPDGLLVVRTAHTQGQAAQNRHIPEHDWESGRAMDEKPERKRWLVWLKRIAIGLGIMILAIIGLIIATYDWPSRITPETFIGKYVVYDLGSYHVTDVPSDAHDKWQPETQTWTADGKTVFNRRPSLFNRRKVFPSDRLWWIRDNRYCEQVGTDPKDPDPLVFCFKVWIEDNGMRIRMRQDTKGWLFARFRNGAFVVPGTVPRVTR